MIYICLHMCLSKYEVALYTIFEQGTRRGRGAVDEVKRYCEHSMFIYVKYTGSYSVMQCILLYKNKKNKNIWYNIIRSKSTT